MASFRTRLRVKRRIPGRACDIETCTEGFYSDHHPLIGGWEHYVLGYNTREVVIFVDGVERLRTAATGEYFQDPNTESQFAVGNQPAVAMDNRGVNGAIDDFFLFAVTDPSEPLCAAVAAVALTMALQKIKKCGPSL